MASGFSALPHHKRALALVSGVMLLAAVIGISMTTVQGRSASVTPTSKVVKGGVSKAVAPFASVDLSKLPRLSANTPQDTVDRSGVNLPLPAAQRAKVRNANHSVPQSSASQPLPSGITPKFVGGGNIPSVVATREGLNSSQSGGGYPPDQAITVGGGCCVSDQWVIEGVNTAFSIYNTNYSLLAGPYSANSLFSPLAGDFLSDPQISVDATRVHWVIAYVEIHPNGHCNGCFDHGYIDIAASKGGTPVGGVPGGYWVYRFDLGAVGDNEWCDYPTLGMEYWNLYVSCATFGTTTTGTPGSFMGNRVFMFSKTALYSGGSVNWGWFFNLVNTLDCGGGANTCPAFRLAPAIEDGVPQAEWVVATNAGYGAGANSGMVLTSITNPNALASGSLPTGWQIAGNLPLNYADPPGAQQPGTGVLLDPGAGIKQFMYKGGRLWFSFTTDILWNGDSAHRSAVYWADIEPFLSTQAAHNPQWNAGWNNHQAGYFGYVGGYTFMPSIMPSDEGDAALVFNYSASSVNPGIVFTGRQNADALGTMGQGASAYAAFGSHPNGSGRWGDYSACALNVQNTERANAFCAGEYGGANSSAGGVGWNTFMYTLRME